MPILLLLVLALLPGPQDPAPPKPQPALRIEGEEVSADALARFLIERQGSRLARDFAEAWVVAKEARKRGIEVTPAEVAAKVDEEVQTRVASAFRGKKEDWLAELERLERTEMGHRQQRQVELTPILLATEMAREGRVVPEEKIVRDWELEYGPQGRAFDLLMMKFQVEVPSPPKDMPWDEQERNREHHMELGRQRALAARARVVAGEDFRDLAEQISEDPETRSSRGWLVGGFRSKAHWPQSFLDALRALEPGELSQPLYARGGWWIVQVLSYKDTPLADVRAALEAQLIARGPEQDEIGNAWNAACAGLKVELQPGLFEGPLNPEEPDPPGLLINGEPVPRRVFASWLLATRGESHAGDFGEAWLVERKARAEGIEASPEEVEARVVEYIDWRIREGHKGSREVWEQYLLQQGRSEELFARELRDRLRVDLLAEKMILRERKVREVDIQSRFRAEYGEQGRKIGARMLMIQARLESPPPAGLEREELQRLLAAAHERARREAADLAARARAGEDFATLARRYSQDPGTREKGGELTPGFLPSTWNEEIAAKVLALEKGGISDPLEWGRAWFVFEVTSIEQVSYEELRPQLERELMEARPALGDCAGYRNVLRREARIEYLPGMY